MAHSNAYSQCRIPPQPPKMLKRINPFFPDRKSDALPFSTAKNEVHNQRTSSCKASDGLEGCAFLSLYQLSATAVLPHFLASFGIQFCHSPCGNSVSIIANLIWLSPSGGAPQHHIFADPTSSLAFTRFACWIRSVCLVFPFPIIRDAPIQLRCRDDHRWCPLPWNHNKSRSTGRKGPLFKVTHFIQNIPSPAWKYMLSLGSSMSLWKKTLHFT